jgi:hypothetical protein
MPLPSKSPPWDIVVGKLFAAVVITIDLLIKARNGIPAKTINGTT